MTKLNLSCFIGTEEGYLKVVNCYNWVEEQSKRIVNGAIMSMKQINNENYFICDGKLYQMDSEYNAKTLCEEFENKLKVVDFDMVESKTIIAYENFVKITEDYKSFDTFGEGNISCFRLLRGGLVAIGGDKTELSVFDLNSYNKPTFKSKSSVDKTVRLPAKINFTSILQDTDLDNIVYGGTAFGTVQLFDIRSGQRKALQVAQMEQKKSAVKLLALSEKRIIVAQSDGSMGIIDFRFVPTRSVKETPSRVEKFQGCGSATVRDTVLQQNVLFGDRKCKPVDVLLTTSMDRWLRVHRIDSREVVGKVHLLGNPTCIIVNVVNEFGDEDIWKALDDIEDGEDVPQKRIKTA